MIKICILIIVCICISFLSGMITANNLRDKKELKKFIEEEKAKYEQKKKNDDAKAQMHSGDNAANFDASVHLLSQLKD